VIRVVVWDEAGLLASGIVTRLRIALPLVVVATACSVSQSGTVQLELMLPPSGGLRPTGMTTVAITTQAEATGATSVTTTQLEGSGSSMHFSAGEVAVGVPITLSAELHDASGRLVGYGEVSDSITPSASELVTVTIPVRKPIVFVSSTMPVTTIDPTLYSNDPMYEGTISQSAVIVVPVDGNDVAAVSSAGVQLLATATNAPDGHAIAISGTPLDAIAVPGQRQLVVGTMTGVVIVDLDAGTTTQVATAEADRVAVGGSESNGYTAYVLSGRVAPPEGAMAAPCGGSSMVFAIALGGSKPTAMQVSSSVPLADLAADETGPIGADPCDGNVSRIGSGGKLMLALPGAAAVAVQHDTVWAAGSMPPDTSGTDPVGARIVLASIGTNGSSSQSTELPPKSETMQYLDDTSASFARTMRADTEVPLDLAVLPTGDQLALIARMDSHSDALYDQFNDKAVPEMDATVHDIVLVDPTTTALTRIRANCTLTVTASSGAEFPDWGCQNAADGGALTPPGGQYTPSAVDAVYGSR